MRWFSSVVAILFSLCNSALADFYAPYSGANFNGFTRNSTIGEWDSSVDAAGLLLDRSGSNLCTRSESFDHGNWAKLPATIVITADDAKAPDGTKTADLFSEGTAGSGNVTHSCVQAPTIVAATTYTFSVYAKYKTSGRPWICLVNGTTAKVACFNIQTGTKGAVSSGSSSDIWSVNGGWYRIWFSTQSSGVADLWYIHSAESDGDYTYTGDGRGAYWLWGGQISLNDSYHQGTGPGIYKKTVAYNKPLLDLSPTAAPTTGYSYLQGQDGNRKQCRVFNGTTQYYTKAHDASMNVFDGDFSITTIILEPSNASGSDGFFRHSNGAEGFTLQVNSSGYVTADFLPATAVTVVGPVISVRNGSYHFVQLVRRSNIARIFVDGAAGAGYSVSGKGLDLSTDLYFGTAGGTYFDGSILYTRLDAEALTDQQLAIEREQIQGTLSSKSLYTKANFTRASSATQAFSDGSLGYAATNIPRVGGDGGGVLVEEQRQNLVLQSQTLAATWTSVNLTTLSADGTTAPDGTATADGFVADATDGAHGIFQAITLTAVNYTVSGYAKIGNKNWIYVSDDTVANGYSYFNASSCTAGTKGAGASVATATPFGNGWCRCSIVVLGTAAPHTIRLASADSDTDNTFAGDTATVNTWFWGAQVELGSHATSYIPTVATAVIRYADSLTYDPWSISKNMFATQTAGPMFWYNFDQQVYSTSTVTSSGGGYTLTTVGNPRLYALPNDSTYTSFDGVSDYFTMSSGDFNPSGAFSIVAVYTPGVGVGTGNIISKDIVATRGPFQLLDNGGSPQLTVWNAADTTSTAAGGALVAGKTSLVTATYDGAGNTRVMVDSTAAGTGYGAITIPKSTANLVYIGTSAGAQQYLGDMRFIGYYNGVVVTQAQHDAMYAQLKSSRTLPVKMGNSYQAKKLYVEFDSKCAYASSTDIGIARQILHIGGSTGTASAARNLIRLYILVGGQVAMQARDNNSTSKYRYGVANPVVFSKWNNYKFYIDGTNMANTRLWVNGSEQTNDDGTCTGVSDFDFTNTLIRFGQDYDGTMNGDCSVRSFRARVGY